MEQLEMIKETLINQVQGQMGNLEHVHTKELGEVIDMIKDLSEASYYCSIVEAMEEKSQEMPTNNYYYTERYIPTRDYDYENRQMYYPHNNHYSEGGNSSSGDSSSGNNRGSGSPSYYSEMDYPMVSDMRDQREGRSPMRRRMYMEAK